MATYSFTTLYPPYNIFSASFSHQFEVSRADEIIISPSARNVWNQFDEHGLIAGLHRNTGEKNWEFRRRIYDAWTNIANSSYRGLINGITRELGLELYYPIRIDPKISAATGKFYAPDPYILFDGTNLYLYSDYSSGTPDYQIDRYATAGNYEKLGWLVDFINSTTYFEASLTAASYKNENSMVVINQSNRATHEQDLDSSTKTKLKYKHIIPNSVLFAGDNDVIKREVLWVGDVSSLGTYHIDYVEGILTTYSIPSLEASIRYDYIVYPFIPVSSEIIIYDINNNNFKTQLFSQILLDDGTYEHGLPNELGVDLINELLTVVPLYFGV